MRNKRYRGDYQVLIDEKNRKTLRYKGEYYEIHASKKEIHNYIKYNMMVAVGLLVIYMVMSFINSEGTRTFYVTFPYIFLLLAVCLMLAGVTRVFLARNKDKYELYDYEKGYARIYHSILGCMILSGICVLSNMILLLLHFSTLDIWKEIVFSALAAISSIISFYMMKYDKQMDKKIKIQKNESEIEKITEESMEK